MCFLPTQEHIIFLFMWAINWLVIFSPITHFPAVLWTAQGHFLVENSEAETINRNTGMFWALLQCRYAATDHAADSGFSGDRDSLNTTDSMHYFI